MNARGMNDRARQMLGELNGILAALPDVFSTAQWGGRAYKLPGRGGSRTRPKLLAFVAPTKDGEAVGVSFKLGPDRAAEVIARHEWIAHHSFPSMASSGWVSAAVSMKRQLRTLSTLLAQSRALYPASADDADESRATAGPGGSGLVARRIDRVMKEARAEGWSPPADDAFDR